MLTCSLFLLHSVCFPSQHMRRLPRSCTRLFKSTNDLWSQSYLVPILQFVTMLERYLFHRIQLHEGIIVYSCLCWCLWTYCIQVLYQSDQFLDKNKDYVVAEHQELLSASKCSFISGLFPPPPEETSKSSKFSSIGARFKVSSTFCFLFSPFCYYAWWIFHFYAFYVAATTSSPYGHIKLYRASLYQMCEAK